MEKIIVYGIPNCDTIKKTLDWFKKNKMPIIFHDYKNEGIKKDKLTVWCKQVGWQLLLNKKSTTWRMLPAEDQRKIINQAAAIQIMIEQTSIIKRPIIEYGSHLLVGFDEKLFNQTFGKTG